jgi:hypothetical protein
MNASVKMFTFSHLLNHIKKLLNAHLIAMFSDSKLIATFSYWDSCTHCHAISYWIGISWCEACDMAGSHRIQGGMARCPLPLHQLEWCMGNFHSLA